MVAIGPMSAVVNKASHIGAKKSSTLVILKMGQLQNEVVSAGEANGYVHPHKELLDRVTDAGAAHILVSPQPERRIL